MTPRTNYLLAALLLLLPALSASMSARAQFVLECPDNRIVIRCLDCIYRGGFEP